MQQHANGPSVVATTPRRTLIRQWTYPPGVVLLFSILAVRDVVAGEGLSVKILYYMLPALLIYFVIAPFVVTAVEVTAGSVKIRTLLGRKVELSWPEVVGVARYFTGRGRRRMQLVRIKTSRGPWVIRITDDLQNFDAVASEIQRRARHAENIGPSKLDASIYEPYRSDQLD